MHIVPDAGHSSREPGTSKLLVEVRTMYYSLSHRTYPTLATSGYEQLRVILREIGEMFNFFSRERCGCNCMIPIDDLCYGYQACLCRCTMAMTLYSTPRPLSTRDRGSMRDSQTRPNRGRAGWPREKRAGTDRGAALLSHIFSASTTHPYALFAKRS